MGELVKALEKAKIRWADVYEAYKDCEELSDLPYVYRYGLCHYFRCIYGIDSVMTAEFTIEWNEYCYKNHLPFCSYFKGQNGIIATIAPSFVRDKIKWACDARIELCDILIKLLKL